MGNNEVEEVEFDTVTLEMEDGTTSDFAIVAIYPVEEQQYVVMVPVDQEGEVAEDAEMEIFRFKQLEDDEVEITSIEDEEELARAEAAFDLLASEEE